MSRFPMFRTFLLTALVVVGLLLLGLLPDWSLGDWTSKPVDVLSDLMPSDTIQAQSDAPEVVVPADSCKPGVTCIADYAQGDTANMEHFYAALNETKSRPVRIAFIGDSFIESDILTDVLRDLLQGHYGGEGVGFVTMDHVAVAGRKTIRQQRAGWEMHSAIDKQYNPAWTGLSGYYFVAQGAASVELDGNSEYSRYLGHAEVSHFLLKTQGIPLSLTASTETGQSQQFSTKAEAGLQCVTFQAPMKRVRWSLGGANSVVAYGVTMEGRTGIVLDNLSLRGSSGLPLLVVSQEHLLSLNALRPYDLVVLQFGLNVMLRGKSDYSAYTTQLEKIISHLRAAMPETAFLVMGISDRDGKLRTGELGTLPEIAPLIEAQANAAVGRSVAFWNTFEAMGGNGAMVEYAKANPPMAAKDYTHINEEGGKRIAHHLFDAILWGHELYNLKHNNQ